MHSGISSPVRYRIPQAARADPGLRVDLEARQVGYVLAVGCDRRVPTAAGPMRADTLTAGLLSEATRTPHPATRLHRGAFDATAWG